MCWQDDFPDDARRGLAKWTHVVVDKDDREETYGCSTCAQYKTHNECVHTLLVRKRALEYVQWSTISTSVLPPQALSHIL